MKTVFMDTPGLTVQLRYGVQSDRLEYIVDKSNEIEEKAHHIFSWLRLLQI